MTEPLKAVEAEAHANPEGDLLPLITEHGEVKLTVPPAGAWKTRANGLLRVGDFDAWAEITLSKADYEAWVEADPTNNDVEAFFRAWSEATGQDPKGSANSQRSSRPTPRR